MGLILMIVLVVLLLGALPAWPYSRGWGYYPSGGLGLLLLILRAAGCPWFAAFSNHSAALVSSCGTPAPAAYL